MKKRNIDITEFFDQDIMSGEPIVVIKKLTFGDFNDIQDEITNIKVAGKNNVSMTPRVGHMKLLLVQRSLVEAPFATNDFGTIRNLDLELGELIYNEVEDFNDLGDEEEDNPNE